MTAPPPTDVGSLPVDPIGGHRPLAWWGTWLFIATEAMLFAGLLSTYFYLRFGSDHWPLGGIDRPDLVLPTLGTLLLFSSSATAHWAERGIAHGDHRRLRRGLAATIALGVAFLSVQIYEYAHAAFTPQTNAYGSVFFGVTGFHGLHVVVGVAILLAVTVVGWDDAFDEDHHLPVRLAVIYWHFVDVVWVFVFSSLYLSEHLA